jgi:hypothetical protein
MTGHTIATLGLGQADNEKIASSRYRCDPGAPALPRAHQRR